MSGTSLIIITCIGIMIAAFIIENRIKQNKMTPEFQCKGPLFSSAERTFLNVLDKAVGLEGRVFGMVRVADVLEPIRVATSKKRPNTFDWMKNAHFDFVICDSETITPICAIALHDDSGLRKYWHDRVEILEKACASAGFTMIQMPWKPDYSITEIRALVLPHLSRSETSHPDGATERGPIRPADYAEDLTD